MYENIKAETEKAFNEIINIGKLKKGNIIVIGCSSSEVAGGIIGENSNENAAKAIFNTAYKLTKEKGIYIACQCCEHLNRALIIEEELLIKLNLEQVNAVPKVNAGGSLATTAYNTFKNPVVVEHIKADAGIDIGDTLIGMHLKETAVPLRLKVKTIGKAHVTSARVRPRYIGGSRTSYNEDLS